MTSDTAAPTAPTAPLTSLARHWLLAAILGVLGLAAGIGLGLARDPVYTAEVRLAVAVGDPSAYAIAGFPLAARDLATDYSRWVENGVADGSLAGDAQVHVAASPIPETGVVRIEGTSTSPEAALAGATSVADALATRVDAAYEEQGADEALRKYTQAAPTLAAAQARTQVAEGAYSRALDTGTAATVRTTRDALVKARTDEALAQLERDAQGERYRRLSAQPETVSGLDQVAGPTITGDDRNAVLQRYGVLGLALGLALALLVATLRDRRRARAATRVTAHSPVPSDASGPTLPTGEAAASARGRTGGQPRQHAPGETAAAPADAGFAGDAGESGCA